MKTKRKHITGNVLLFISLALTAGLVNAQKMYVSDQIDVTVRSGTSNSNSIIKMLSSGDPVTVLAGEVASKYSLVKTADGKQGYILTRYLMKKPAASQLLENLKARHKKLKQQLSEQKQNSKKLNDQFKQESKSKSGLESSLTALEKELVAVRQAAASTLEIQQANTDLSAQVEQLRLEMDELSLENESLSDSTRIDWFVRGGLVALLAFLVGLLITRIAWQKKSNWGSY